MPPLLRGDGESRRERIRRLVAETPATPVAELSPGRRAVTGTVVATDAVRGPLTDEECVLVEFERGRYRDDRYEPVGGRVEAAPFVVEDDTGRVLVDPAGYGYDDGPLPISPARTERFEGDESGENLRPVDEEEGPVLPWIHAEAGIRPGDEVYVVGEARRIAATDASPPDRAVDPTVTAGDPDGSVAGGSPADGAGTTGPDGDDGATASSVEFVLGPGGDPGTFVVTDLSRTALHERLDRPSALSGEFWRYVLLGLIAVAILLTVVAIFVGVFVL